MSEMKEKPDSDTKAVIKALQDYKNVQGNTLTSLARQADVSQSILTQAHRERVDTLSPAVMKRLVPILMPGYAYGIHRVR
ncbi:hypothetical protein [Neoaquamicrobium sediminum]|uniref:hypothetical protein n=1 Tax=Neoaquamicrobium sediminum TaxID=1849104 RepID=UPI0040370F81